MTLQEILLLLLGVVLVVIGVGVILKRFADARNKNQIR